MTSPDDYDSLPEALRLALLEWARREHAASRGQADPAPLNLSQIAEASATPITIVNRRYHVALLRLRRRARELDL